MEKVYDPVLDETVITHTLDNGLQVMVLHKKDNINTTAYFAVPFGALTLAQKLDDGTIVEHEPGLAHFLEHKLFENHKGMDVMERFSALSCNVNAFTSYTETVYYFNTSKTEIEAPLNLLLDFVQSLNVTEASVDKEKKIIIQELRMYHQMPEARLMYETYRSLYNNVSVKYDIGGSEESVSAITKAKLETAFNLNYHPTKALLVVVSSLDPDDILSIIETNQKAKPITPSQSMHRVMADEPLTVVKAHKHVTMDIAATKMTYSFKLAPIQGTPVERHRIEWALKLRLELVFSTLNPVYQDWVDQGFIHDYFGYEVEVNDQYAFVMFYGETEDETQFRAMIDQGLALDVEPLLPFLRQLKRRYRSYAYRLLDDQDDYAVHTIRGGFTGVTLHDSLKVLEQLQPDDLRQAMSLLKNAPTALVAVKPRKVA